MASTSFSRSQIRTRSSGVSFYNGTTIDNGRPVRAAHDYVTGGSLTIADQGDVFRVGASQNFLDYQGAKQFEITSVTNAVNNWTFQGAIASSGPTAAVEGADTDIKMNFYAKGAGGVSFYNSGATNIFTILGTGKVGIQTETPSHYLSIGNAGKASAFAVYNTTDETTNYERIRIDWASNIGTIATSMGGTGTNRTLRVGAETSAGAIGTHFEVQPNVLPFFKFTRTSGTTSTTLGHVDLSGITMSGNASTQIGLAVTPTINQTSTASYIALYVNPTETGTGSGTKILTSWAVGGTVKASMSNAGKLTFDTTITAGGTTGARTIDKPTGTVNFAAAATAIVVTNNLVTTSSYIFAVVQTNDTTAVIKNVVPGTGSFTITLSAAATAETRVAFFVLN